MNHEHKNFCKVIVTKLALLLALKINRLLSQLTQVKTQCLLFGTQFGELQNEPTLLLMNGELKL